MNSVKLAVAFEVLRTSGGSFAFRVVGNRCDAVTVIYLVYVEFSVVGGNCI